MAIFHQHINEFLFYSTELGPGWAPAFFEIQKEIDFIRQPQSEQVLPFIAYYEPYWIAGSVNLDSDTRYLACTFNVTRSGSSAHV